jgi:cyclic pyranopterin phosphate synthase
MSSAIIHDIRGPAVGGPAGSGPAVGGPVGSGPAVGGPAGSGPAVGGPDHPLDRLARPLHDLRISVTDRCNFRCPYCMPKEQFHDNYRFLKSNERLSFDEITRLSRVFAAVGVRKLRLTGGEPLLRANLAELIGDLSDIPGIEDIALTTNGVLLGKHAVGLRAHGLRRITVSLDSLDKELFTRMSGGFAALDQVLQGIEAAIAAGLSPIKINTVIERGVNDHAVFELLEHFRGRPVIVRLIEFMDVGNRNQWRPDMVVPSRELAARIHERWPIHPLSQNYDGEVAKRWQFDDGGGEIGFISSVSQPFCGACSRARLSSEGKFYTCLFVTQGLDLREPLRSGASDRELQQLIRDTWLGRTDRYSELRDSLRAGRGQARKIEMYYIGG